MARGTDIRQVRLKAGKSLLNRAGTGGIGGPGLRSGEPVTHRLDRPPHVIAMRRDVLTGNVADELLKAVLLAVEHEA